jgi:uncharacterized protein (DUF924 family)
MQQDNIIDPKTILSFWFSPGDETPSYPPPRSNIPWIVSKVGFWFNRNENFEKEQQEIADKYLNKIRGWEENPPSDIKKYQELWDTAEGCLARVIMFDQIPRSVYRATAVAFEFESLAVKYAFQIVNTDSHWSHLTSMERVFVIVFIFIIHLHHIKFTWSTW